MLFRKFQIPILLVLLLWIPFLAEIVFDTKFNWLGIYPREWKGLIGIFTAPFIHGDLDHLASNSLPMLVLGGLTYYFYRPIYYKAHFYIAVFGGLFVWVVGEPAYHIGASGVIYGLAALLVFNGMFRKSYRLVSVAFIVIFLYGSMIWGVLPIQPGVSWESHLGGALVGLVLAVRYRKWVFVEKKVYRWQDDEEDIRKLESRYGERYWENPPVEDRQITIRYIFKPNKEGEGS